MPEATGPAGPSLAPGADDWDDHWTRFESSARENPAQAYRRRLVFDLLDRFGPPDRLLDVGSGQGDLLLAARRRWPAAELAGVELSQAGIDCARTKVPGALLELRDLTEDRPPAPALAGWASHAVCSEVLEHVDDPVQLLARAASYVQPGGMVVITVPGGEMSAFDRHIGHRRHHDAASITAVVASAGLEATKVWQAGFPFFNVYRRMVIARGHRLIEDVDGSNGSDLPGSARLAMRAFDRAFALNRSNSRWGTQIVAVAGVPRPSDA